MPVTLNWLRAKDKMQLDGTLIRSKPGNEVILRDIWNGGKRPEKLTVFENVGRFKSIRNKILGRENKFDLLIPAGRSETEPWLAGTTGMEGQTEWKFTDRPNKATSGPLLVTLCEIALGGQLKKPFEIPLAVALITPGGLAAKGRVRLPLGRTTRCVMKLYTLKDPTVRCSLLLPWAKGNQDLLEFMLSEVPGTNREELVGVLRRELEDPDLSLSRPGGWEVSLSKESTTLQLAAAAEATIAVDVRVDGPGTTVFAVRASVEGDPSQTVVSDLIHIEALSGDQAVTV